ncbi:glycoside hydrolase family 127 protein [Stakelama sediminis]|uniref:Glycoside hydrolase family 127 protein n=1 Tax=Stakelama sediminis TaxID=463200 RepID=A0A840YYD0_9SPHN|nr:glycoside hydrolase family 127 protein [Stakelama sediminis]MBB5718678.1 hypothetical protein [Stakelama sediminis]
MLSRRTFLASASAVALAGPLAARAAVSIAPGRIRARPVPLADVRLSPGPFYDAVMRNRDYLLALEPDRLLHNFRAGAGLKPKAPVYGGWEARGIAGHTLGHYLSACSLMHAQTGDEAVRDRIRYIVGELSLCQKAHGDGYVGGTTVERDGKTVDGKIVFEEVRRGRIETHGFDINGGWVPLYTWHKVHAGLIDAYQVGRVDAAMPVMLGMAGYLATILEGLDDAQMQKLLASEYGGLNESYANTYALTGDERWLRVAEKIYDRKVLDPIEAQQDKLAGLHANTQIPKIIGLARIHELTGDRAPEVAATFFHRAVTQHHSYVIGGNSEREHFGPPDAIATFITDRTCEGCNSYNMLKLTRHLYGWAPDAALFDYYEKVHLNHILGQQNPQTGMFNYFMSLASGARRLWSTPDDSFWCCVGTGLESHSKHGDSIYWHHDSTLFVNLFIPSRLNWREQGLKLVMDTRFPFSETVEMTVEQPAKGPVDIAVRMPGWSENPSLRVNGETVSTERSDGYARLHRRWRAGDRIELVLPMAPRVAPTPDDPSVVAYVNGPLVLAADLGPVDTEFTQLPPALVAADAQSALQPTGKGLHQFRLVGTKPQPLTLRPFFAGYDRRSAVYFPTFTHSEWSQKAAVWEKEQRGREALARRTVDLIHLGEQQPEQDHHFKSNNSDLLAWGGHTGRQAWWGQGNYLAFDMAVKPGPMVLRALYWGEETDKDFVISIDGHQIAVEKRPGPPVKRFVSRDYPIPETLTRGKSVVRVRFETRGSDAPVYVVRMLQPAAADSDI